MSWVFYAIISAILWAVSNVLDKLILTKWVKNPSIPIIIYSIVGTIFGGFIYFFHGFSSLSNLNVFLALLSGVFLFGGATFYFKAIQFEEISRIVPIFYFTPGFIAILAAIFLGEIFALEIYFGIFLLIFGAILITSKNLKKITFGKPFWLMTTAALITSVYSVLTKYLLSFADFWTVFAYSVLGASVTSIPLIIRNYKELIQNVKDSKGVCLYFMFVSETTNAVGLLIFTFAKETGYVTLVNALSSIQPFLVLFIMVLLSLFLPKILKEEISKKTVARKFIAIVLMFIGVMIITS